MSTLPEQIIEIKNAIAALENQRAILGDAVVETALAPLRERLAALQATGEAEQRKQITVLFADVSGFTAMSETLDAELVRDTMNALWQRLDAAITAQGGAIDKHIGDAIMALWGVAQAHEDDPECAIRAALAMQQEIHDFVGATLVAAQGAHAAAPLQMRIGINTGPVMLGAVGTTAEFTAMGDTVNLASRLEHAAPIGGILISHETYRHVRGIFDVTPQPPLTVKGKREPIQTYVVQRAKPRAFRMATRGVEGIETRTVGREAELLALQNALRDAMDAAHSQTRVLTIVGEAGVGKSRLLYEFENWLELLPDQILFFKGRGYPELTSTPYSVLRDLFRYRFDIRESDSAATVREKFEAGVTPYLDAERAHLAGHLVGFDLAATTAVHNLLGSSSFGTLALAYLTNYFRGVTAENEIVIFVEDVHWADSASLDFIAHLAAELPDCRLLIVCLARPSFFEHRPHWGEGQAAFARLDLEPLSKRASHALVDEILQKVEATPAALRDLIVDGTEGNPFYVEELIKMLIEDGVILRGDGAQRWRVELERLKQVRVPPTLTGVLQARLDSLPHAEKELLQRASVVGRQFWDMTVATLSEEQLDAIRSTLDAIRARELVFQRERSAFAEAHEYIFKHALLRDVTYETVLLKLRRVYHRQVAQWLQANCGERLNEYAGLIAEHYERAGETELAATWLRRAGETAFQTSALPQAIAAFRRALELLPESDWEGRAALLVKMGDANTILSDYLTAKEQYQAGLAQARAAGNAKTTANALSGLSHVSIYMGAYEEARGQAEEALAVARAASEPASCALALAGLGRIAAIQGNLGTAIRFFEDSLALYQDTDDEDGLFRTLVRLGESFNAQGNLVEAIRCFEKALAICRRLGNRGGIALCLTQLGNILVHQGDYVTARRYYEDSLSINKELGLRRDIAKTLAGLGECYRFQGNYVMAAQYGEQALLLYRPEWGRRVAAIGLGNLGHYATGLGDDGKARRYFREALIEAIAVGTWPNVLDVLVGVAGLRARAGQNMYAAELLGLVLGHPACQWDVVKTAEPVLAALRAVLPAEELQAAMQRGQSLDLEQVVKELLADEQITALAD